MLKAIPSALAFMRYIRKLIRQRRVQPTDDLLGALVSAEPGGDQLSEDELVAMVFLLLVAGHETTVNLIANGTLALLENPEQLQRLRAQPELVKSGVEEMLRYYSPVELSTERYARDDMELLGVTIPRSGLVYGVLSSANRDEAQFPRADQFDAAREPNRHLAFGQGAHFCVGAPLARLEGQIAIMTLLRHTSEIRLAVDRSQLQWRRGLNLRSLQRLPVTLAR
jgi:cytochrome P450 PksS